MTLRQIRIGNLEDIHQYDDADFDAAVETDQPIRAGTPSDSSDVMRLGDLSSIVKDPVEVIDISNPTELNSISGAPGSIVVAFQTNVAGNKNLITIYAYDSIGPAVDSPYIVDAPGSAGERWIAVAGEYSALDHYIKGDLTLDGDLSTSGTASISSLPTYSDNAAAISGGLSAGDLYRTGSDPDTVCVVH